MPLSRPCTKPGVRFKRDCTNKYRPSFTLCCFLSVLCLSYLSSRLFFRVLVCVLVWFCVVSQGFTAVVTNVGNGVTHVGTVYIHNNPQLFGISGFVGTLFVLTCSIDSMHAYILCCSLSEEPHLFWVVETAMKTINLLTITSNPLLDTINGFNGTLYCFWHHYPWPTSSSFVVEVGLLVLQSSAKLRRVPETVGSKKVIVLWLLAFGCADISAIDGPVALISNPNLRHITGFTGKAQPFCVCFRRHARRTNRIDIRMRYLRCACEM